VGANVLFRSLDEEARQDLLKVARIEAYESGEVIAADAADEKVYLVYQGKAAVLLQRGGAACEVAQLEKGAIFGEGRVVGQPVAGALVARGEVAVVTFPAPVVAALAERFPRLQRLLESVRAAHLRSAARWMGGPPAEG
jgi:signal-transduction protein with cAMP-binding, CBS, and nucleotidyltransferase domain